MAGYQLKAGDVLAVIDVQNDFCPGGALAVPDGDAIVPVINRLIGRFPAVIATQDWHPPGHASFASSHPGQAPFASIEVDYGPQTLWPDHCVQGSPGAAFHTDLAADAFELVIRKGFRADIDSYSAFQENDRRTQTGLAGYLKERGVTRVFCCGLAGDVCVYFSAVDAKAAGFECVFIEDACRDIDMDGSRDSSRADLAARGIAIASAGEIGG